MTFSLGVISCPFRERILGKAHCQAAKSTRIPTPATSPSRVAQAMIRMLWILVSLALISSSSPNIHTSAFPTPALVPDAPIPILARIPTPDPFQTSQHTLQVNNTPSPKQKLCGFPLSWIYPCKWTSDPSVSRLQKLGPVIFVKYIVNIPGTLVDSILSPLTTIKQRGEGKHSNKQQHARNIKYKSESGVEEPTSAQVPTQVANSKRAGLPLFKEHLSSSASLRTPRIFSLPALLVGFISHIPRALAEKVLIRDLENTKTAQRDIVCKGGGNEPIHDCQESGGLSLRVPRVLILPVMLFKAVKAIPLGRFAASDELRFRKTRSAPLELENLNSTTAIQDHKTAKGLCRFIIWGYYCRDTLKQPKPDMPYEKCLSDEPSLDPNHQTYTCGHWIVPSAGHVSRSIPRIFTIPVMLIKTVRAIPVSRSSARISSRTEQKRFITSEAPLQLENLNGTTAIQDQKTAKALCWWFIWGIYCSDKPKRPDMPTPPPYGCRADEPSKSDERQTYTCEYSDKPSAAHASRSIPRIFTIPVLAAKTVSATSTGLITRLRTFAKLTSGNTLEKRRTCNDNELQNPDCENPCTSSATSLSTSRIFRLPLLVFSLIDKATSAALNRRCSGSERQNPDCEVSYPSSSSSLSSPRVFKLPLLILAFLRVFTHAIPFPRPATITNSIADPNFDLVRKSVSEVVDGLGQWLGKRSNVDWDEGPCGEGEVSTEQVQCGMTARGLMDSAGSREGVSGMGMAGLGVLGVAIVFAGFL